ncbi:assimilatory sulfite reductase (NADPH) flavoprotein subunit [Buchnera aphidicola (Mollitrichosiphum nigrofasciatum)]|uniref:assimilatory sulfite reductase (NADPH) flavoprotein subunit n=1 Tax=Buchnera aphidicola TaxID=9 RepID=UPI0031B812D4
MDKLITQDCCPIDSKNMDVIKSITNNLSNMQISWLSGYFWGIANNYKNQNISCEFTNNDHITIISASQTGNARLLSEKFYKKCIEFNISAKLLDADEFKFKKIINEKLLIIIISTQGEGEIPDNACDFYNFLISKRSPKLDNLHYSIFSLGDKTYDFFCKAGKDFDKILRSLGGKQLLPRVDADIEYKIIAKKWIKKILKIIIDKNKNFLNVQKNIQKKYINQTYKLNKYTKNKPFKTSILINQKITGEYANKDIRHIEIDLASSGIQYLPGDAIGVWYQNNLNLILKILKLLNIVKNTLINYNGKDIKILYALKKYYELTVNTYSVAKKYLSLINYNYSLNILKSKKEKLKLYSYFTPIVDMISYFPKKINSDVLINILRPLQPRLYSISSSQLEVDNEIHITVAVVKYNFNNNMRFGGSSYYLSNLLTDKNKLKIYVLSNKNFRLPEDKTVSIIMICAGTGIAPFRAFIQDRYASKASGKNWLFFGNQFFTEDFLYQLEWQKYYNSGILTRIDLAFSRDQHIKERYIQEKINLRGKDIWQWVQEGAHIYVCGNIKTIAKSAEIALLKIFIKYGNMNSNIAYDYLNKLRCSKRYQRDVY